MLENQGGNCVWDASRRTLLFPAIVSPYIRRHLVRPRGINIAVVRASWKWKRWGWQLREFLFPIITALSCDLQSRLLLREVILWSSLTMPAYWKRGAPPRRRYPRDISLFEKRLWYLFIREKRPRRLFIRETYAMSLYIFDTKRIRDEISARRELFKEPTIFYNPTLK